MQNLGFPLRAGGWKVLHVGDTEATAEDFALNDLVAERIDVAFLPGWYLGYTGSRRLVDAVIRPRRIVAMHPALPSAPASYFGEAESFAGIVEASRDAFPEALVLIEPGSSVAFAPRARPPGARRHRSPLPAASAEP